MLPNVETKLMLEEDLIALVNELKESAPNVVEILDTATDKLYGFSTKRAAAKFLKCDREAIRAGRTNLYKKQYKITVLDDANE